MRLLVFALPFLLVAQDRALRPIDIGARKALVIGNSAYPPGATLRNPGNDARAMQAALRELGFDATLLLDANKRQMAEAVDAFARRLGERDLALVYFAGHGVQVRGENYLIPVDFNGRSEADVEYNAYQASLVRAKLEETRARVRLLLFDACRNNPYRFKRDGAAGLAPMNSNAEGTAIIFGAGDGQTADDNAASANGLFTTSLLSVLRTPGLGLDQVFKRVQAGVYAASQGRQFPAVYDQIIGSLVLRPGAATPPVDAESVYWQECRERKGEFCRLYLERYPAGQFARLAQAYLATAASSALPPVSSAERGQRAINPKDGLAYVRIPAGEFMMGCTPGGDCNSADEKPLVKVRITDAFYLGETEVTQRAFEKVSGSNPSHFKGAERPVESVGYSGAERYCRMIGGRLPTEAEWEWAARGGLTGTRYGKAGDIGWHEGNSGGQTHVVKGLRANDYGLYDMLGNVWEWTSTWYAEALAGGTNPKGPASGEDRVVRGGAFSMVDTGLRASIRLGLGDGGINKVGFRCVWEPQ